MQWRKGDDFPKRPPWPARPSDESLSPQELQRQRKAYDVAKAVAQAAYMETQAVAMKAASYAGPGEPSPLRIAEQAGPSHPTPSGVHKVHTMSIVFEGVRGTKDVTTRATPEHEEDTELKKRAKSNRGIESRARKSLLVAAQEAYIAPKHTELPAHLRPKRPARRVERAKALLKPLTCGNNSHRLVTYSRCDNAERQQ